MQRQGLLWVVSAFVFAGCASPSSSGTKPERGPDGTVAYFIQVETSEPCRIEVNEEYVGNSPMAVRVFADRDGTFHNFGSSDFILRVTPIQPGHPPQSKVFRTGGWFAQEDRVPGRVYFDLASPPERFSVDPPKPRY